MTTGREGFDGAGGPSKNENMAGVASGLLNALQAMMAAINPTKEPHNGT